jgi:hypothetical protein
MFSRKSYSKGLEDDVKSKLSTSKKSVKEYTEGSTKVVEESYEGDGFSYKSTSYYYQPEEYDLKRSQLEYQLNQAVECEDYDLAAKIKNEITELTKLKIQEVKQKQNDKTN